jgi:hypothetical protein
MTKNKSWGGFGIVQDGRKKLHVYTISQISGKSDHSEALKTSKVHENYRHGLIVSVHEG